MQLLLADFLIFPAPKCQSPLSIMMCFVLRIVQWMHSFILGKVLTSTTHYQ